MSLGNISSNTNLCALVYSNSYSGIAACNYFMDNVDKTVGVDPAKIAEYKGEVRFLRALFYFELSNTFGGVPLYKHIPTGMQ